MKFRSILKIIQFLHCSSILVMTMRRNKLTLYPCYITSKDKEGFQDWPKKYYQLAMFRTLWGRPCGFQALILNRLVFINYQSVYQFPRAAITNYYELMPYSKRCLLSQNFLQAGSVKPRYWQTLHPLKALRKNLSLLLLGSAGTRNS